MKYTIQQREEIGRRIYNNEISRFEASKEYGINESTARDYMRMYRDFNNLPAKDGEDKKTVHTLQKQNIGKKDIADYESMTKEELISLLIEIQK